MSHTDPTSEVALSLVFGFPTSFFVLPSSFFISP